MSSFRQSVSIKVTLNIRFGLTKPSKLFPTIFLCDIFYRKKKPPEQMLTLTKMENWCMTTAVVVINLLLYFACLFFFPSTISFHPSFQHYVKILWASMLMQRFWFHPITMCLTTVQRSKKKSSSTHIARFQHTICMNCASVKTSLYTIFFNKTCLNVVAFSWVYFIVCDNKQKLLTKSFAFLMCCT